MNGDIAPLILRLQLSASPYGHFTPGKQHVVPN